MTVMVCKYVINNKNLSVMTHPNATKLNAIEKASKKLEFVFSEAGNINRPEKYTRAYMVKALSIYKKIGVQYYMLLIA